MISIQNDHGELVKVLKNVNGNMFGLHKLFGMISQENAVKRMAKRQKQGVDFSHDSWLCKFSLSLKENKIAVATQEGCEAKKISDTEWTLQTDMGLYKLLYNQTGLISESEELSFERNTSLERNITKGLMLFMLSVPFFLYNADIEKPVEDEKKKLESITVTVVKPVNTVKVNRPNKDIKVKPLTKSQVSKRAVKRNLGFLGLVGSKSLSKVNGGVPQKLKTATAGAGKGGDAGSGGEVLTGLGKGLKKTTVGNTGVAGLGGIGTKGAGGGKGGYGNTMVASGEGSGISAISVASNDVVLDGGLSRYAINATIAKYLSQVRRCYESELNRSPNIEGLVTVAFSIGGSGMLNYSKVKSSSLRSPRVEKCITQKMMTWKFPKPKGGVNVKVDYPFMLRPVGR